MKFPINTSLGARVDRACPESSESLLERGRLDAQILQQEQLVFGESRAIHSEAGDHGEKFLDFSGFDWQSLGNHGLISTDYQFTDTLDQKKLVKFVLEPLGLTR